MSKDGGADLYVRAAGFNFLLCPVSEDGKAFIDENVDASEAQFIGKNLFVEARYVEAIVNGAIESGLEVINC